jgi:hypothetical protein
LVRGAAASGTPMTRRDGRRKTVRLSGHGPQRAISHLALLPLRLRKRLPARYKMGSLAIRTCCRKCPTRSACKPPMCSGNRRAEDASIAAAGDSKLAEHCSSYSTTPANAYQQCLQPRGKKGQAPTGCSTRLQRTCQRGAGVWRFMLWIWTLCCLAAVELRLSRVRAMLRHRAARRQLHLRRHDCGTATGWASFVSIE